MLTISEPIVATALVVGAGTGAAIDVATRRIPNVVPLGTAWLGLAIASTGASGVTVGSALLGFAIGFLVMLPGHLFGATGAGDVKLFAAVGTILGHERILLAFLLTAIAGGLLAIGVALRRGQLRSTFRRTAALAKMPVGQPGDRVAQSTNERTFAYGPAIAAGSLLTLALWG